MLLAGCGSAPPAAPTQTDVISVVESPGPIGDRPLATVCDQAGYLVTSATSGSASWSTVGFRIGLVAVTARSEDAPVLRALAEAATARATSDGAQAIQAWTSALAAARERCATVGVELPD